MFRKVTDVLVSTKTAVWLLSFLVVMLFAGAAVMPLEEAYQSVHSMPFFDWMEQQPLKVTWWLWGALFLLCILAANTVFCSIDSLARKRSVRHWLLLISLQVVHLSFLFMLLAHLLSSLGGFKNFEVASEGKRFTMPDNTEIEIGQIQIATDRYGYLVDWRVNVSYFSEGKTTGGDILMPNEPAFRNGIGVYVRDLRIVPLKMVLLEISREPGAFWALIGGVLFMTGTVILLVFKIKKEPQE